MVELTKEQWLKLGGGAIAVLKKHGSDAADLMADIPKAISLAKDMAALVNTVQQPKQPPAGVVVPPTTQATFPAQTEPHKSEEPVHPSVKKISAEAAIQHIKTHGVSDAEKAIMDRASQVVG